MTLPQKLTTADTFLHMLGSNDVFNNYQRAKDSIHGVDYTTDSNTTAVNRPWWEQSTTAAPKPYGYDSEDCYKWPQQQPSRATDNTGAMPANWEELLKGRPWSDEDIDEKTDENQERDDLQAAITRMMEEIRRQQAAERQRQIDAMRETQPTPTYPVPNPPPNQHHQQPQLK